MKFVKKRVFKGVKKVMMKRYMKKGKGVCALVVATALMMALTACGNHQAQTSAELKEYVYVPEYIELDNSQNLNMYNMQVVGNSMYYTSYSYDEVALTASEKICKHSLETGEVSTLPVAFGENRSLNGFCLDEAENVYTIEYQWNMTEDMFSSSESYFLCKYDAAGNQLLDEDITDIVKKDDEYGYINRFVVDASGRYYATADDKIRLFDAGGQYQGDVNLNGSWIQGMGIGKDGKVYATYYDTTSSTGGYVLAEVMFESKQLGQSYENFPNGNGNGNLIQGLEGDFLVNDGSQVYEYSIETQATTELLSWLDSDINGTYVEYVGALEDGRLFAVIRDWNTNETEIASLTKTRTSELPEKEQIVIGTLYENQSLQAAAVSFNKGSDTYRVTVKTYIDTNNWTETSYQDGINNLNNDIVSGSNCPDILDISQLDINRLAAKGVFEDLTPYLEQSSLVSKDDFLESVVNAYTINDKLICIPNTFNLSTVVGKTAEVGSEMGWTLEELMAYSEEHEGAMLFDYASKALIMHYLLTFNQNQFIDWSTGECTFDSEAFTRILEFVNEFPDEFDYENDERSTPVKIQAGDVLLDMITVYELNTIQQYDAMFNEPITFIGYPNDNGDSGCYLTGDQMYAIASKAQNKDGAWAFIEDYLSKEPDDMFSWGLPTNKALLDEKIVEETTVEYVTDENGELVLDEEGNPIAMEAMSGIGYGDWEYTFHTVTQEEVDRLLALIDVAKPISNADQEIMKIIEEESEAFFQGQKSAGDVAEIIQSRVQIYVNENR